MQIDLHTHTTASDGSFSPTELVQLCLDQGIGALAITDHDTTAGLDEARKAAEGSELQIITGVEISAKYKRGTLHILGLQFDEEDQVLQSKLALYQEARHNRNKSVIAKLQGIGLKVSYEELLEFKNSDKGIGRPHIANLLLKKGYVKTFDEAFQSYLGIGTPGFVPKEIFTADEAISFIKNAGGLAVVAHPNSLRLDQEKLRDYLEELQSYNSSHDPRQVEVYKDIAYEYGFLVSGGSDFHGSPKPNVNLGHWDPEQQIVENMVSPILLEE